MGAQLEQGTPGGRTTKLGVWGLMAGVSYVSLMLPSFHGAVIPGNGHCGPCSRALSGALWRAVRGFLTAWGGPVGGNSFRAAAGQYDLAGNPCVAALLAGVGG